MDQLNSHKEKVGATFLTAWDLLDAEESGAGAGGLQPWKAGTAAAIEGDYNIWFQKVAPKVFTHSFTWFHRLFLDWYWPLLALRASGQRVPEDTPLAALLALGRGLGKSAILEGLAVAEGAHFGRSVGLYVSSTKEKVREHLQNVRVLIEASEVARYYPGLSEPRIGKFGNQRGWRGDALFTASGFTMIAASLEQGVRGLRDLELRPTFIELDDLDERDDSPAIRQEKFETVSKDIIPMQAPFGLVVFTQNLIYSGSLMEDTLNRKLDWFHLRHAVGPINTFQDDLDIQKVDGRPVIVAGTPNWERIDRPVAQDLLNKIGEESFRVECQNQTAPSPEKLVWTGFNEQTHVISWAQFAQVFGSRVVPGHWFLYAGYDAGSTGPERHPAVFSVAAVGAEDSPMSGDIFVVYEYVAEAGELEDDMAKALILDLAKLCGHYAIKQAAGLVANSYGDDVSERTAWQMREQAGRLMPFKVFNGSHEARSERRTFQIKWGLPMEPGKSGKTEGLSQLRFFLKLENKPHPFKPGVTGRPNLYLVVAGDQLPAGRDRWGLARHRWEAANLKWDPNVTTRDVPAKFGDDASDAVKFYMASFALDAAPMTKQQQIEEAIDPRLRLDAIELQEVQPTEGWWMSRARAISQAEAEMKEESEWEKIWRDTV